MGPKPKKINLNQYTRVSNIEDTDGFTSLIITPPKSSDGTQLPDIYYVKGDHKDTYVSDPDETTVWSENIKLSTAGEQLEYIKRIDWWVENALKNQDYRDKLNSTFNRNNFNIRMSWDKAVMSLKGYTGSDRKTHISKFIWNWLIKGYNWQMRRLEKGVVKQ